MFHFQSIEIVDYILKLKKKLRNFFTNGNIFTFQIEFYYHYIITHQEVTPCIKSFWMLKFKSRTYIL